MMQWFVLGMYGRWKPHIINNHPEEIVRQWGAPSRGSRISLSFSARAFG